MGLAVPDESTADPLIGRAVGNYRVERKLGEGGMGAVYLLVHTRLPDTRAALKVMNRDGAAATSALAAQRFEQEARAAAAVGSHRVVKPLDIGEFDDGTPYIVMEHVAGRSLHGELLARGPLPVEEALRIASRIADTMAIAHARGIIHRDLKPHNVMLAREGRDDAVRLLDFGVARLSGALKVAHTGESVIIGTPGYLSPEAAVGAAIDGRSDVFSLGVMLFEMLTGALPFEAPDPRTAITGLLARPAPPLSSRLPPGMPPVPRAVEELVAAALEKDPELRPEMAELLDLLAEALGQLSAGGRPPASISDASSHGAMADTLDGPIAPTESPTGPTIPAAVVRPRTPSPAPIAPPTSRRGRRVLAAGVAAAFLAVLGAAALLVPRRATPPAASVVRDEPVPPSGPAASAVAVKPNAPAAPPAGVEVSAPSSAAAIGAAPPSPPVAAPVTPPRRAPRRAAAERPPSPPAPMPLSPPRPPGIKEMEQ